LSPDPVGLLHRQHAVTHDKRAATAIGAQTA
jgi:hypothetical protein